MKRPPAAALDPTPVDDATLVAAIEGRLADWLAERPMPPNLRAACDYAVSGGGKRVRPLLALRCCAATGGDPLDALVPAAAIEFVHTFSLVHDDLPAMDDDDLRRGRETLHKHTSEALAILAGDALLGLAFELLAQDGGSAETRLALVRELALANDDMIAGQVYDTLPDFPPELSDIDRLELVHRNKTRALIRCACRMGAIAGGADGDALKRLTNYGEAVGLMFQIVDDLLDVTQTTEHLGKTAQKDAAQGKLTYPGLIGLDASRTEVERLRAEGHEALSTFGGAARPLRELCDALATRTR